MKVRDEIIKYADADEKEILLWLLDRYHMASEWRFVACCEHRRYGEYSYQTNRVWHPTKEGKALFKSPDLA